MARRRREWWNEDRERAVRFLLGCWLAYHEVVVREGTERPSVLLFITGLVVGPTLMSFRKNDDKE